MLKLVRNTLSQMGSLTDNNGKKYLGIILFNFKNCKKKKAEIWQ